MACGLTVIQGHWKWHHSVSLTVLEILDVKECREVRGHSPCEFNLYTIMYIAEVNRTDDDCEQQSPSVAVRLQQLTTTPAEKNRDRFTTDSCGLTLTPMWTRGRINIFKCCIWNANICSEECLGGGPGCDNRISDANLLIMLHSNYRSVLLSFRYLTTGRMTYWRW